MINDFSIVIPTYNAGKVIAKLLKKISEFTDPYKKEVIVIDSSSSDSTLKIVSGFTKRIPGIKTVSIAKQEFDHGETRNLGVRLANGKFVCFFSQDAVPEGNSFLSYYFEDFNKLKKVVAIYGKHISSDETPLIQKVESDCFWEKLDPYLDNNGILLKDPADPFIAFTEENKYLWYELSDTSSCYLRKFLLDNPFPKTMYGEDMLMGKLIINKKLCTVFDTLAG